jgi:hypothetical protein
VRRITGVPGCCARANSGHDWRGVTRRFYIRMPSYYPSIPKCNRAASRRRCRSCSGCPRYHKRGGRKRPGGQCTGRLSWRPFARASDSTDCRSQAAWRCRPAASQAANPYSPSPISKRRGPGRAPPGSILKHRRRRPSSGSLKNTPTAVNCVAEGKHGFTARPPFISMSDRLRPLLPFAPRRRLRDVDASNHTLPPQMPSDRLASVSARAGAAERNAVNGRAAKNWGFSVQDALAARVVPFRR